MSLDLRLPPTLGHFPDLRRAVVVSHRASCSAAVPERRPSSAASTPRPPWTTTPPGHSPVSRGRPSCSPLHAARPARAAPRHASASTGAARPYWCSHRFAPPPPGPTATRTAAPRLPCFAPPLGHAVAIHPAASAHARGPHRAAAGQPPPRVPSPLRLARHRRCGVRGWAGKTPLPLTSGARWSVEGVGGIFLYLLIDFG